MKNPEEKNIELNWEPEVEESQSNAKDAMSNIELQITDEMLERLLSLQKAAKKAAKAAKEAAQAAEEQALVGRILDARMEEANNRAKQIEQEKIEREKQIKQERRKLEKQIKQEKEKVDNKEIYKVLKNIALKENKGKTNKSKEYFAKCVQEIDERNQNNTKHSITEKNNIINFIANANGDSKKKNMDLYAKIFKIMMLKSEEREARLIKMAEQASYDKPSFWNKFITQKSIDKKRLEKLKVINQMLSYFGVQAEKINEEINEIAKKVNKQTKHEEIKKENKKTIENESINTEANLLTSEHSNESQRFINETNFKTEGQSRTQYSKPEKQKIMEQKIMEKEIMEKEIMEKEIMEKKDVKTEIKRTV